MLLGLTGLALLRLTAGGGGLPAAGPDDSRESRDGHRGLIGSLKQKNKTICSVQFLSDLHVVFQCPFDYVMT